MDKEKLRELMSELGRRSAKARKKKLGKKYRSYMKSLSLKALEKRSK